MLELQGQARQGERMSDRQISASTPQTTSRTSQGGANFHLSEELGPRPEPNGLVSLWTETCEREKKRKEENLEPDQLNVDRLVIKCPARLSSPK